MSTETQKKELVPRDLVDRMDLRISGLVRDVERLMKALLATAWSNHPEGCWCAVPERDSHDDACMQAKAAITAGEEKNADQR